MLIKGIDLTPAQRTQVLEAYVHRWTHENSQQTYQGRCPGCEQSRPFPMVCGNDRKVYSRSEWHAYHVALTTDDQWLADHAFHFVKDGSRLSETQHYAEPVYMAEAEVRS